jgi:SAM-dependent methyltransferase
VFELLRRLARWRRRHPALPLIGDTRTRAEREAHALRLSVKALGAELARQRCAAGLAGPAARLPPEPVAVGLGSRSCRQADIEHDWLRHWCGRLGIWPAYHRKVWEVCFIAQAAWEAGALQPGRRALGFAVGREPLPSLFAAAGAEVVATDLPARDRRAREWVRTGQNAGADGADGAAAARRALFRPDLVGAEEFDARVRFRAADMRRIPPDLLRGGFDLVWSACAMEHLGGLGRGADFVLEALRCLRPGGVAVHTTELNLDEAGDDGTAAGEEGPLDAFVDLPPFGHEGLADGGGGGGVSPPGGSGAGFPAPHLRLSIRGYPATSVGILVRAAAK